MVRHVLWLHRLDEMHTPQANERFETVDSFNDLSTVRLPFSPGHPEFAGYAPEIVVIRVVSKILGNEFKEFIPANLWKMTSISEDRVGSPAYVLTKAKVWRKWPTKRSIVF